MIKRAFIFCLTAFSILSVHVFAHNVTPHGDPPEVYRRLTEAVRKEADLLPETHPAGLRNSASG